MVRKIRNFLKTRKEKIIFGLCLGISILIGAFFILRETQFLPQNAIVLLENVVLPGQNDTVLIFAPHQDDETLGAGGYIIRAVENKANVYIVLITNGNSRNLETKRNIEFQKITKFLGVPNSHLLYLNLPDGQLSKQDLFMIQQDITHTIKQVDPDIIIYPIPQDRHIDHQISGKIIEHTLGYFPQIKSYAYLVHYPGFPRPEGLHRNAFILPPLSMSSINKRWETLNLTLDEENKKCAAIYLYRTQFQNPLPFLRNLMVAFCRQNEIFLTNRE